MLPSIFGENLFDDWFDRSLEREFFGTHSPLYGKHAKNLMKTDVKEVKDGYELAVDLPGFKKDEVQIEINDGYLTISAAKKVDREPKEKDGRYIRQERYCGQCSRSFYVGDVQPEEIKAKFEDGILKLDVPKKDAKRIEKSNRIEIE